MPRRSGHGSGSWKKRERERKKLEKQWKKEERRGEGKRIKEPVLRERLQPVELKQIGSGWVPRIYPDMLSKLRRGQDATGKKYKYYFRSDKSNLGEGIIVFDVSFFEEGQGKDVGGFKINITNNTIERVRRVK